MPVKPPISATMLVSVARSSIDMASTAGPAYSNTAPMAWPCLIGSVCSRYWTMSRATTPGRSRPVQLDAEDLRHPEADEAGDLAVGDVGRARAEGEAAERARNAAYANPCRSTTWPGSAYCSVMMGWQMPSEPALVRQLAMERVPDSCAANCRCASCSSSDAPARGCRARAGKLSSARTRWSWKAMICSGRSSCEVGPERVVHEVRAHAGEVVVAEAPVGAENMPSPGRHVARRRHLAPRDDLLDQRQRPAAPSSGGGATCLPADAAGGEPCCTGAGRRRG